MLLDWRPPPGGKGPKTLLQAQPFSEKTEVMQAIVSRSVTSKVRARPRGGREQFLRAAGRLTRVYSVENRGKALDTTNCPLYRLWILLYYFTMY